MNPKWKQTFTKYFLLGLIAVFVSYLIINGIIVFVHDRKAIALAKQSFAIVTAIAGMGAKWIWDVFKQEYQKNTQLHKNVENLIERDKQQQIVINELAKSLVEDLTALKIELGEHTGKEFGHSGSQNGIQNLERKMLFLEAQVENHSSRLENLEG